jgi:hypothetical protein
VFVISGPILLSLIPSNRVQVQVHRGDVQPVRADPYTGIEPGLLQAMKDMNLAREPEDRAKASEALIAFAKVLNSHLDAGKDAIKQEIQGKSFGERLGYFSNGMDGYTFQEKAEIAFTFEDLPQLYATLDEPQSAGGWWTAVMVVAILEPDKEKAFKSLYNFFQRPEDWNAFRKFPGWSDITALQKYCAVSGFGYVNSDKSSDFLLQLMKKEKARELVVKSSIAMLGLIDISECTMMVQVNAARGIMLTRNDALIPHLIDANIQAAAEFYKDSRLHSIELTAGLDFILAQHYYYKDHGWEGGYRLSAIMDVPLYPEIAVEPIRTYYDEYLFEYYSAQKVYKMQHERGLVTTGTTYYLEKYKSIEKEGKQ